MSPGDRFSSRGRSRFVLLNAEMPCHVTHSYLHFTARFTLQCSPLQVNCHASKHLCRHQAWLQPQRPRAIQVTSNRSCRRKGVSATPIVLLTGFCYSLKALTAAASCGLFRSIPGQCCFCLTDGIVAKWHVDAEIADVAAHKSHVHC